MPTTYNWHLLSCHYRTVNIIYVFRDVYSVVFGNSLYVCMSSSSVHQKIILNPYLFHSAIQVRELTYITAHCQSGIYKVLRLSSCDENFERIFPWHTSYIQPNLCMCASYNKKGKLCSRFSYTCLLSFI